MRVPRPFTRPWIAAAAVVAIAAILVATGVGNTHATEPADQQIEENTPGGAAVGTPLNASATGGSLSYALTGPDAASFTINAATGEVSLASDVSPDFEARSEYSLIVTATADVTVQVLNVDEPGAGETITAALTDPDGGITNARWSWAHSDGDASNAIPGATAASYTTATADIGHRITAMVSYDDATGAGVAQRLVHHGLAPVPSQEVALAGRAESDWSKIAHLAVVAVLTPARFVGVDHRTGADLGQDFGHCGLGLLGGAMHRVHDGPRAEV